MTTAAIRSFGVVLKRNGNVIGEVTQVGDIEIKQDTEDVTSHQSTARYNEIVGTILKGGDLKLEGNFLPSDTLGQIGLKGDMEAGTLQVFTLDFPPAILAQWTFNAVVTSWKIPALPVDKSVKWEATLEISGQPVLSLTASAGLTTPFLAVSGAGTLIVPAPANAVYNYVANIVTTVTNVTITPTAAAGVITITANGVSQVVTSGAPSTAITLGAAGSIVIATISVKETGKVAVIYIVDLTRAA